MTAPPVLFPKFNLIDPYFGMTVGTTPLGSTPFTEDELHSSQSSVQGTAKIAAYALVVDAKDESAAGFYAHHGFIPLPAQPLCLFLPLATVKSLLG